MTRTWQVDGQNHGGGGAGSAEAGGAESGALSVEKCHEQMHKLMGSVYRGLCVRVPSFAPTGQIRCEVTPWGWSL